MRVLEGGCSVPVGVETELVELPQGQDEDSPHWTNDVPKPTVSSPTLHFSGLLAASEKYPSPTSTSIPPLIRRRANLVLKTCVTSLDGDRQIVYAPPAVLVKSYAEAERWGELCAAQIRDMGAGEILAEINVIRKERERIDFEKAKARSLAEASMAGQNGHANEATA
jgi:hydroxymethylbilane synthase